MTMNEQLSPVSCPIDTVAGSVRHLHLCYLISLAYT